MKNKLVAATIGLLLFSVMVWASIRITDTRLDGKNNTATKSGTNKSNAEENKKKSRQVAIEEKNGAKDKAPNIADSATNKSNKDQNNASDNKTEDKGNNVSDSNGNLNSNSDSNNSKSEEIKQEAKATTDNSITRNIDINKLKVVGQAQQILTVTTSTKGSYKAKLNAYEKVNGAWTKKFSDLEVVVGKNGFFLDKKEGDSASPSGAFTFGTVIYNGKKPQTAMVAKLATKNDYWVSDSKLEKYNVWINKKDGPDKSWKAYRTLSDAQFKYSILINYNVDKDKKLNKGSGIFLYATDVKNVGTGGGIGISETNMLKLLAWLKPEKKPMIVQGTEEYLSGLQK